MLIFLFTFLLAELLIYKAIRKYKNSSSKSQGTAGFPEQATTTVFSSKTNLIYIQVCQIVVALIVLYIIKKTRDIPLDVVMIAYIFTINLLTSFTLIIDHESGVNDFEFFFILSFSFINRQYSVYIISIFTTAMCIVYVQIRYNK